MSDEQPKKPNNPMALSPADAARVLAQASGASITEAMLRSDLAADAPANADGTINLLHYAAWLVKEMTRGD